LGHQWPPLAAGQSSESFEYGVVRLLAPKAFHRLAPRHRNACNDGSLILKGVDQARLPNARFSDDKNNLSVSTQGIFQIAMQFGHGGFSPYQSRRSCYCFRKRDEARGSHISNEAVATLGQSFDKSRGLRVIAKHSADFQNVPAKDLRLHVGI